MNRILILTGGIRTGKTTVLSKLVNLMPKGKVSGVLAPDINELRHIRNISDNEIRTLEVSKNNLPDNNTSENHKTDLIRIGKFLFLKNTFDWACERVLNEWKYSQFRLFILDEIGPLELSGKGLNPAIESIFQSFHFSDKAASHIETQRKNKQESTILIVVRSHLLENVKQHYKLENAEIISLTDSSDNASRASALYALMWPEENEAYPGNED